MTKKNAPLAIADADGRVWTRELHLADSVAVLDGARKTRDGYLVADARVARVGCQEYRGFEVGMPDKERVILYRPPEEVFSEDSMRSHANKPVTLTHPSKMVDPSTWGKVAKGISGTDVMRDGDFVRIPLMLTDAATIKAFEDGEARELSVGYTTNISWTPGVTPTGEAYDGIQRDIRTNHHALVPVARGGSKLRLGDGDASGDAEMLPSDRQTGAADGSGNSRSNQMAIQKVIDSVPVEFADEKSAAVVAREIDRLQKALADAEAKCKKMEEEDDDEEMQDAKKLADANTALAAAQGKIAVLEKQLADAALTDAQIDAKIAERAAVLDSAKPHLPKGFDHVGKSIADIRRATVVASLGDAAKDMDDAMVTGAFVTLTAKAPAGGARAMADGMSSAIRNTVSVVGGKEVNLADAEARAAAAFAEMEEAKRNAWKRA